MLTSLIFFFVLQTEDVFNEIDFCFSYLGNRFYLPVLQLFLNQNKSILLDTQLKQLEYQTIL